jgi:hypothetical protein
MEEEQTTQWPKELETQWAEPVSLTFQKRFYTLHVGNHILIFFLGHIAKGNVGFWHHIVSVVCCLSSVNFSHFNLLL